MSCKNKLCDSISGVCFDCIPAHYGLNCTDQCSKGCRDTCNKTFGFCECKKGFYSADCSLQCSENCKNSSCLQESGICVSSIQGKYGNFCQEDCLGDCDDYCVQDTGICRLCAEKKYGFYCNKTCPENCKNDICERNTGKCRQCPPGFMGEKCLELCPDHCEECSQDGYECKKCEDGWYGIKCKNPCRESCGGNKTCDIESGLCHVCSVGYFGNFCEQKCSEHCDSSNTCDKISGHCHSCNAGKRGKFCAESCSEHCRNLSCFLNESCINGCEDDWFGPKCTYKCNHNVENCDKCQNFDDKLVCQHCSDSWFLNGSRCVKCPENCSSCLSDSECHECKHNLYYGEICNLPCNSACRNKTCDITGQCILECDNSKYGTKCDQDCPVGCRSCHNASVCTSCENGFYMNCERCENNATCREYEMVVTDQSIIINEDKIIIHAGIIYGI